MKNLNLYNVNNLEIVRHSNFANPLEFMFCLKTDLIAIPLRKHAHVIYCNFSRI